MKMLGSLFVALAGLIAFPAVRPGKVPVKDPMKTNVQRALAYIDAFEKTKNPEELGQANNILASTSIPPASASSERLQLRQDILHAWLRLLSVVDANLDPAFHPEDKPAASVGPPGAAGAAYMSGTRPEDVADPTLRKQYEEAIEKNRQKSVAYNFQTLLRRVNETATPQAERFIWQFYSTAPFEQKELREEIAKTVKNPKRAEQLLGSAHAKP